MGQNEIMIGNRKYFELKNKNMTYKKYGYRVISTKWWHGRPQSQSPAQRSTIRQLSMNTQLWDSSGDHLRCFSNTVEQKNWENSQRIEERTATFCQQHPAPHAGTAVSRGNLLVRKFPPSGKEEQGERPTSPAFRGTRPRPAKLRPIHTAGNKAEKQGPPAAPWWEWWWETVTCSADKPSRFHCWGNSWPAAQLPQTSCGFH